MSFCAGVFAAFSGAYGNPHGGRAMTEMPSVLDIVVSIAGLFCAVYLLYLFFRKSGGPEL